MRLSLSKLSLQRGAHHAQPLQLLRKLQGAAMRSVTTAATPAPYNGWVQPNADAKFPAETDRYHLYMAYACPFASRALTARNLKGLEDVVGLSVAHPIFQKTKPDDDSDTHRGWAFVDPATTPTITGVNGREYPTTSCILDSVNHVRFARDLYEMVDKTPRKFSVPILWDKKKRTIVSNESADIVRMFNSGFGDLASSAVDIVPTALESEVDAANNGIVAGISTPYFKAAFAHDMETTQTELAKVFAGVAKLEQLLASKRFLVDSGITEADIRMFHLLIRVDVALAEGSEHSLTKYPNVVGYLRDLYAMPAIKKTVNWDHLRIGIVNHKPDAPHLTGPYVDYDGPTSKL